MGTRDDYEVNGTRDEHRAREAVLLTQKDFIAESHGLLFVLGLLALDRAAAIPDALEHNLRESRELSKAKVFWILCNLEWST